ncbi:hypothetical protein IL252_11305 [Halomicrobium sp. IBSBa]|uniref:hypothetical protein n=1 Tax=Halomicrobium sp. IBSBa TaxID=2778916 RepID=UPI001ABF7D8F|nr:hypothetical protein [Halomicrobium sp. IBSBa]MBO4248401.1 hypothetical protein [Halomicrobium sp. IBSBa]
MESNPEYRYDRHREEIYVEVDNDRTTLYSNASRKEFEVVSDIEELVTKASALSERLIDTIQNRDRLVRENQYFPVLNTLQEKAGDYYEQCLHLQSVSEETSSEIIQAKLGQLYKLNKLLKHYFRMLSVAQSIGFSERLVFTHLSSHGYVFLYGFVRNVCSTLEYLGKLLENRQGKGTLGLDAENVSFKQVYKEIQNQGIDETFNPEQKVEIPGKAKQMKVGEIGLNDAEMDFLWDKRNDIVHHCPMVVQEDTVEHLPDDLLTTAIFTESDTEMLTRLASRVHLHSIGMFLKYISGYIEELLDQLIEAWYHEREDE